MHTWFLVLLAIVTVARPLPLTHFQPGADVPARSDLFARQNSPFIALNASSSVMPSLPNITAPNPISAPSANASSTSFKGDQKYVIAHHMVGNTFPYTVDNWSTDIALAHSAGIDGFALNVGADDWQPQRVADAYQAAEKSNTTFKLFLSFDMSSLPCTTADDANALRTYVTKYSSHPNQLMYNGKVFSSTFAGESCKFGQSSVPQGWSSQFTQHPDLSGQNAVHFVPSFFVDPATFGQFNNIMDGVFNFNSGWPIQLTTSSAQSILSNLGASLTQLTQSATSALQQFVGSTSTDTQYVNALATIPSNGERKSYMAAVSPWFFTHYSPQTFDKNFIYLADSHLYPTRWESLVSARDQVDLVEIVTWNDYGESHYIGPIKGSQPNSQAWVDGLNHTGWLDMTSYFATAYKTGSYPNITEDKIYLWARTHPRDATTSDPVGKPSNFELTQDTLWAVVMATAPATVTLSTSNSSSSSQTFSVPAGLTKLSMPLTPGGGMRGTMTRNDQNVVDLQPEGYVFEENPTAYNFNAFVAYSG